MRKQLSIVHALGFTYLAANSATTGNASSVDNLVTVWRLDSRDPKRSSDMMVHYVCVKPESTYNLGSRQGNHSGL